MYYDTHNLQNTKIEITPMFNKLRTAAETVHKGYNTARMGVEWYQANEAAVHDVGRVALQGVDAVRAEGSGGMLGRLRQAAGNFLSNPENRERVIHIGTEMGGAAVRGALLETGAKKENGKWSAKGVLKSILGLKTGTTYVRAAKGAYQGARAESVEQWSQHGEALRGAVWGATQEAFNAVPTPSASPNTFNPFAPSTPGQFAPASHTSPFQAPPRYEPMYTIPQPNFAPQPGHGRTGATPFDAGYPAANNPFGAPNINTPRTTFSPPPVPRGADTHNYF